MTTLQSAPIVSRFNDTNVRDVMDHFRAEFNRRFILTIRTEYVGPTDTKGSCYKSTDLLRDCIHWEASDYSLTTPENHLNSAINMIREFRNGSYQLLDYSATELGYQFQFVRLS